MGRLIIHTQDSLTLINEDEIAFCKSDNSYTSIYLYNQDMLLISKSLAKFSKELDYTKFIRVNQSYLVNVNFIKVVHKKKKHIELLNNSKITFTKTIRQLVSMIEHNTVV